MSNRESLHLSKDSEQEVRKELQSKRNWDARTLSEGPLKITAGEIRQRLRNKLDLEHANTFSLQPEFFDLFNAVDAINLQQGAYIIQFLASARGDGTTTVAFGFASAASVKYALPVLYLDSGMTEANSIVSALLEKGCIDTALNPVHGNRHLFKATLNNSLDQKLCLGSDDLRDIFSLFKERFSAIVLDSPAVNVAADSLLFSKYCDGTVLVVCAEKSGRNEVTSLQQNVERFGGTVIGAVLNRRRKYVPEWIYKRA